MTAGGFYEADGVTYDDLRVSDMGAENVSFPGAADERRRVVYAAIPNARHVITFVHGWYDSVPTGGNIRIEYGDTNVLAFRVPVTGAGTGFLPVFLRAPTNTRVRITLAPGGGTVRGYLNVGHRVERPIP